MQSGILENNGKDYLVYMKKDNLKHSHMSLLRPPAEPTKGFPVIIQECSL